MSSGGYYGGSSGGQGDQGKGEGDQAGSSPDYDPTKDPGASGSGWSPSTIWKVQRALPDKPWVTVRQITGKDEAGTLAYYNSMAKDPYYDYRLVRGDEAVTIAETLHSKEKDPSTPGTGPGVPGLTGDIDFSGLMPLIVMACVVGICCVIFAGTVKEMPSGTVPT